MPQGIFLVIIIFVILYFFAPPSTATLIATCDSSAASELDPHRPNNIPGVPDNRIDPNKAIPACESAVKAAPDDLRLRFELGRAYLASHDYEKARANYLKASDANYVAATYFLAKLYGDAIGVSKDTALARRLMFKAASNGLSAAIDYLDTHPADAPPAPLPARSASSIANQFLPQDVDPNNQYETYTFDELADYINGTSSAEDVLLHKRVKVFARYDPSISYLGINKTEKIVFSGLACQLEICDRMELLVPHVFTVMPTLQFTAIYFRDPVKYGDFKSRAAELCSFASACYIWAIGTLHVIHTKIGFTSDKRLAYIDVDNVQLYKNPTNEAWVLLKTGAKYIQMGSSFGATIAKFMQ